MKLRVKIVVVVVDVDAINIRRNCGADRTRTGQGLAESTFVE